jgi:Holliday junction resolvase
MKDYKYGKRKEQKVAQLLRSKGSSVKRSPASRGSADLTVTFPTGTKWRVQVKSSRRGEPASPSRRDLGRLKQSSIKRGATAVIAKVSPRGIEYTSARSGRKLTPPSRRRR